MAVVDVVRGQGPIVLGLPHTGTEIPPAIFAALNSKGQELADTDWHVDRLYADLVPGLTAVRARFHRYVIDANRNPGGESLYPGQNTTGLVPLTDFDGHEIWKTPPGEAEVKRRRTIFHAPYHVALRAELDRVKAIHGVAILYDCHSIRSNLPYLFEGTLPDFSIGTNSGKSCAKMCEDLVAQICDRAAGRSLVVNGRFKGGWTTRYHGRPEVGVHAIQMELAQSTYLQCETAPWIYDQAKATALRLILAEVLSQLTKLATELKGFS